MRKWQAYLLPGALLALFILASCGRQYPPLTEADTVTPRLEAPLRWVAGQPGSLEVRLQAILADGAVRPLGFGTDDPVATVTFFRGAETLATETVTLSHRC